MKRVKIKNEQIAELSGAPKYEFPKYTTQVINLANQDAGGTRPAVVGQMSELIQEFDGQTVQEWIDWLKGRGKDFTFYTGLNADFEGPLTELREHNTMYTCLRRFGSVSKQYESPIRIVLSRNKSASQKYGSAYVYLPFSTMDEMNEWMEQNW